MKKILLIILCFNFLGLLLSYSQSYNMSNTAVTTCAGIFYDSGGSAGTYSASETYTKTFTPSTAGSFIQFVFNSFSVETCCDELTIYDGPNVASPLIGVYTSNPGTITATNATGQLTFVFTSDGSIQNAGWDATISCYTPPTYPMTNGGTTTVCEGLFVDDGGSSGNYVDHSATWVKTFCSDDGNPISISFAEFETREAADYMTIYDGPNTGSPVIGTYSLTTSPGTVVSTGTCITFGWTTDGGGVDPGWIASISCIPPVGSDYLMNNTDESTCSGTFYDSGGSGGDYSSSEDFQKTFSPATPGQMLQFVFTSFQTESVSYDYLSIYDGPTTASPLIGTYGGSTTIGTITATNATGELTFVWHSDGSVVYDGWAANISCVPPPTVYSMSNTAVTTCSGIFADNGGIVANYNGTSYTETFTPGTAGMSLKFVFTSWAIGDAQDYLIIYDGPDATYPSFGTFNASTGSPGTITATNATGQITYVWYSDGNGFGAGWSANISCVEPPPPNDYPCGATPLVVSGGSISYQTGNLLSTATLSTGMAAPGCGSLSNDIWFKFVVPASGRIIVDMDDSGGPTDFDMAWYSSSTNNCANLNNLIECDAYDSQNGSMAMICHAGAICTVPGDCNQEATLTPGSTVWVRVWENGGGSFGTFLIGAYEPDAPGAASTCATAETIASIPFSSSNTTCCRADDYDATDGCASSYQAGEDYLYKYTPSVNQVVDITLTGTSAYCGVFITDACPSSGGATCIASMTSATGNPMLCGAVLNAGTTYYIMIDTDGFPACTPFNIYVTSSTSPTCNMSYSVSTTTYSWDSYFGTNIVLPIDDRFCDVYIPIAFPLCYDGYQYTGLLVSSNGYLIFDPISCSTNLPTTNAAPDTYSGWSIDAAIPNTTNAPRNAILGPWHDIDPAEGGAISYGVLGTAPNRRFIVSWINAPLFSSSCGQLITQQIKIFESTNNIEIHLKDKEYCIDWNDGAAIMGLHNYNGTIAIVPSGFNYPTTWEAHNKAWKFTYSCPTCITLLPIELVTFTGKEISDNSNILEWTTASETNNNYFEVQRLVNENDFSTIGFVNSLGNSNQLTDYEFVDNDIDKSLNYYRLKQTDKDGKNSYSSVIRIGKSEQIESFDFYPNPATNIVSFNGVKNVKIFGIDGKLLFSEYTSELDISSLAGGVYIIQIEETYSKLFIEK